MEILSFQANAAAFIDSLNLGVVGPASSDDILIRVINKSANYQAKGVIVSVGGTNVNQLFLSSDGDNFTTSLAIGDIPPGGLSGSFTLRRVTPKAATGTNSAELTAVPTSWTSPADTSTTDNIPLDME